jgi:hypothetical protein
LFIVHFLMRHILFFFLDGIGLGDDDLATNPFARADLKTLQGLLDGKKLLRDTPEYDNGRALFFPTDANMGVSGPPQSASGQAAILTGLNVPQLIGGHWGPKPNEAVKEILQRENVFKSLAAQNKAAVLINAYPQRYFDAINRGKRMYSAIPMAVAAANIPLMTADDLRAGRAFSADFTGEGWRTELKYEDTPLYSLVEAGKRLAQQAQTRPFTFFENWVTDVVGHRGTIDEAVKTLERFDTVLGSVLENWNDEEGLVIITSDHGNLEDFKHTHHTQNKVPTFVIGRHRARFGDGPRDLTLFAPAILSFLNG